MEKITKEWLANNTNIDSISTLLIKDVELHPYLLDFYYNELIELNKTKKVCLTPQGKLDTFQYEFNQRQSEKLSKRLFKPTELTFHG